MLKRGRVTLKNFLLLFMVLQPVFDSYVLYSDEVISFFGFSPTTILRFLLIGLIFVYLFFQKLTKKENKYIFLYGVIVLIYTIVHHFVCINIDESILYKTFKYNLIGELFYLLRLVYPIILLYIVYMIKPTKKEFKFVIQGSAIILSIILISLNLTVLSRTSYFNKYITGNFFDWNNKDISRYYLAGKGWFNSANQIGGLMLVLFPINFYYALNSNKKRDIIILLCLIISSYSLGTRISCIGVSLVLIVLLLMFYIFKLLGKKICKQSFVRTLIIVITALFIFNYAPVVNLSGSNLASLFRIDKVVNDTSEEQPINLPSNFLENIESNDICSILPLTSTNSEYYEELYPCYENIDFWTDYTYGNYTTTDNRLLEKLITNEVYNKIENTEVNLFGMSRSRYENAKIYLEKDVIVHYYTIGIVGILIFIVPYFIICGYIGTKKLFTKKLTYWDICILASIMLPILVSILTGHIIDELIVTLYIGFCTGYLVFCNFSKKDTRILLDKKDKRKKVLFVVDENRMGGVSILLQDIIKKINNNKYKISIVVLHDVDNYLKKLPDDVEVFYGSNFFNVIDYNLNYLIKQKKIIPIIKKIYLIFLMKTNLIKYKIIKERKKILNDKYDIEIAFKDGFTAVFTAFGDTKTKIHWLHYEYKKYNANGNYPKLFNKILPTFNKIIAVSENVMNDFNEIYHLEDKTTVIANIIDTEKILKLSQETCKRQLNKDKINIICVGRLHECKGYDRLITAISKLSKKEINKLHVEIYGDGNELEKLTKIIEEKKLTNTIYLKGRVDNPYKYIKNNDLFILCSHFETFGLVIVEAMTLGVPVFALENSNTSNLISHEKNGYIAKNTDEDLYNGLKYLIKNKNIIKKYKENLSNYKYDNQKIIKSIEELLDEKQKKYNHIVK